LNCRFLTTSERYDGGNARKQSTTQKREIDTQYFTWKLLIEKNHGEKKKLHYNSQITKIKEI